MLSGVTLTIQPGDRVLDIGSGHDPHPQADVLADLYLEDDRERLGPLVKDRPLVQCDVTALPFSAQSFDYIITAQLLEHVDVDAINDAISELMRVGKKGYIETPSSFSELFFGWPFHRWYIHTEGDRLIFTHKPLNSFSLGVVTHKLYANSLDLMRLVDRNRGLFYVMLEWDTVIHYEVHEFSAAYYESLGELYRQALENIFKLDQASLSVKLRNLKSALASFVPRNLRR